MSRKINIPRRCLIVATLTDNTYRDSRLLEVEAQGECFPHEHVRVVTGEERSLQLLQLPTVEVRPGASSLAGQVVIAAQLTLCNNYTMSMFVRNENLMVLHLKSLQTQTWRIHLQQDVDNSKLKAMEQKLAKI